jgi:DNA repair protein NreA
MEKDIKFEVLKKIANTNFKTRNVQVMSKFETISPPSVFIGSGLKYPLVNVGILSPLEKEEEAWMYDDCKYWAKNDFGIKDVVSLRENLLNSRFTSKATDVRLNNKFIEIAKEVAIAQVPVDVEIELSSRMQVGKQNDKVFTPHGLRAPLKNAKVVDNVKVPQKLDKVMNDEIKASEGIGMLYKNNFDEYSLSKILSVGVLGMKKAKKLVPTRWSITATDDTIGKGLLKNVREYKWIDDFELHFGEFMGNCYLIMMFPGVFSFELFELYLPSSSWNPTNEVKASTDWEGYGGRKGYAFNTAGGYYATRLPILEYMEKIKKQATVVVIRIEQATYWAALGVWVVRETVKKSLEKDGMKFDSKEEMLSSCKKIGKIKYDYDCSQILNKSKLLTQINTQKNLGEWF